MDMTALFFDLNNDIVVTAKFPEITDGTGITAEFYYKDSQTTPDDDPDTLVYQSGVTLGDDGVWFSTFEIPATDNDEAGAFWWRVDAVDVDNKRRTAQRGTLLVESV
jgi:hypothetical protein